MISSFRVPVKEGGGVRLPGRRPFVLFLILILAGFLVACEDSTTEVSPGRFGETGEIRVDVNRPLAGGTGGVETALVWRSDGRWVLAERIRYRGEMGAERVVNSRLNPGELAPEYASLIRQLNETVGLRIVDEVPSDLDPACEPPRSTVSVTIVDALRDSVVRWDRCGDGDLFDLTPAGAGPDPQAARIVTAAQLVRFFTLGDEDRSAFRGSIPFAQIDAGETSPAAPPESLVFVSDVGEPPGEFVQFWTEHAGSEVSLPQVDWSRDMVIVASTGPRTEAGHRLRVGRVLPVGTATRVEVLEERPGDFCAPASRDTHPFHIVVAPRGPTPVTVSDPLENRVPCGL
ncbi:MAG: hypothetical protein EA352_01860 [Gemmatimonadales bacterium]|nr:MAG: hypothetical protein EA352_01860 [Gemmatimonadales bacterium]